MIIERIKSIVLLVLVSLSLLLTYQLWYGQKPTHLIVEEEFERVVVEKPRPLVEVITPAYLVLRTESGLNILKESDPGFYLLWETLSQQLQNLTEEFIAEENITGEGLPNLLTVYLEPALPVGSDLPWLPGIPSAMIGQIELFSLNELTWLALADSEDDTKTYLLLSPEKAVELTDLIAEISAEDRIVYALLSTDKLNGLAEQELSLENSIYLPQEPVYMDYLILRSETLDRDLLLRTFFIDYKLARIIEEKDGGLIYTDGERGLRLTNVGLEYSYPRLETGQTTISYPDALENSSSLISYHGGWPVGLRLEGLNMIRRGLAVSYEANWRTYHEGYPLYINKPTRAIFNDRGLIHYTRTLFVVENEITDNEEQLPVAEWTIALQAALDYFDAVNPGNQSGLRLEEMELGYVLTRSANLIQAEPVWVFQINGFQFFLRAVDLDLLSKEELL